MEQGHLDEIIEANPGVDRSAISRSRRATKKLAHAGIKLGGYRLMPALSISKVTSSASTTEQHFNKWQALPVVATEGSVDALR